MRPQSSPKRPIVAGKLLLVLANRGASEAGTRCMGRRLGRPAFFLFYGLVNVSARPANSGIHAPDPSSNRFSGFGLQHRRSMNNDYRLHLNFLPVVGDIPPFTVYRKLRAASEPRPDRETACYSFAKGSDRDDRADFWVKATPADSYEIYVTRADENNALTRWALSLALKESIRSKLPEGEYFISDKGFIDEVASS